MGNACQVVSLEAGSGLLKRQMRLTGQVSRLGVPNVLNMLPMRAKSEYPPSNRVERSIGPAVDTATFMNENGARGSSESGVGGRLGPISVKKLAMVTPRDHLSSVNGL